MKNPNTISKTVLVSFVITILLSIFVLLFSPSNVFAGTSWGIAVDSYGGVGISVRHNNHGGGCGHYGRQRVETRTTTIVRGGGGGRYYDNYRPNYHRGVVHRQQGRRYYQGSHGRRVIVVPSRNHHRRGHGGYRY